jgi:hypothetical protein
MEETTAILGRKKGTVNRLPGWQQENEQGKAAKKRGAKENFKVPRKPEGYKVNPSSEHRLTEFRSRRFLEACYRI